VSNPVFTDGFIDQKLRQQSRIFPGSNAVFYTCYFGKTRLAILSTLIGIGEEVLGPEFAGKIMGFVEQSCRIPRSAAKIVGV